MRHTCSCRYGCWCGRSRLAAALRVIVVVVIAVAVAPLIVASVIVSAGGLGVARFWGQRCRHLFPLPLRCSFFPLGGTEDSPHERLKALTGNLTL